MPLSEEDRRDIALRHGKDINNPHVLAVANAAYALGVERARKVRALNWSPMANDGTHFGAETGLGTVYRAYKDPFEDELPWTADFGDEGDGFATLAEAKAALLAHLATLRAQLAAVTAERDAALEETAKLFEEVVPMCCEAPHPGCAFCIQASHDAPMCCAHPEGGLRWEDGPEIAATIRAFAKTRRAAIDAAREGEQHAD